MDRRIMESLSALHGQSSLVDGFFIAAARYSALLFFVILAGAMVYHWYREGRAAWRTIAFCALMCAVALGLNLLLRELVGRERPFAHIEGFISLIYHGGASSFPSNHAASSFAIAIAVFYLVNMRSGVMVLLLSVIVALSRVYVGVHYPSDVLGGVAVAAAVCGWLYCFRGTLLSRAANQHGDRLCKKSRP